MTTLKRVIKQSSPSNNLIDNNQNCTELMPTMVRGPNYDQMIGKKIIIKRIHFYYTIRYYTMTNTFDKTLVPPQVLCLRIFYKRTPDILGPPKPYNSIYESNVPNCEVQYAHQISGEVVELWNKYFSMDALVYTKVGEQIITEFPVRAVRTGEIWLDVNIPMVFGIDTFSPANGQLPLTGSIWLAATTNQIPTKNESKFVLNYTCYTYYEDN